MLKVMEDVFAWGLKEDIHKLENRRYWNLVANLLVIFLCRVRYKRYAVFVGP